MLFAEKALNSIEHKLPLCVESFFINLILIKKKKEQKKLKIKIF